VDEFPVGGGCQLAALDGTAHDGVAADSLSLEDLLTHQGGQGIVGAHRLEDARNKGAVTLGHRATSFLQETEQVATEGPGVDIAERLALALLDSFGDDRRLASQWR